MEIELQPLLCEVNLNVEYDFSQTALRRHIDPTVKSKWERWVSEPEEEGGKRNKRRRVGQPPEAKQKANLCQDSTAIFTEFVSLPCCLFYFTVTAHSC